MCAWPEDIRAAGWAYPPNRSGAGPDVGFQAGPVMARRPAGPQRKQPSRAYHRVFNALRGL